MSRARCSQEHFIGLCGMLGEPTPGFLDCLQALNLERASVDRQAALRQVPRLDR